MVQLAPACKAYLCKVLWAVLEATRVLHKQLYVSVAPSHSASPSDGAFHQVVQRLCRGCLLL